ncbi:GILT domain-containing protein [Cephalotus follicularis]|uniref:GILT domain-containing protein n=1 Tax=Cephalotus follicularis TaxID=3775 RepID=A0A1Q3C0F3_CEPFO|nr:GILT domain-containing protein [Cephalotus follicularis]
MASLRRLFTFALFSYTFFLLISPSTTEKVTVSLYYETLCPYCANFIVNSLAKVFENGLISVIDLRLVPWGNALVQANGSFACQHGPNECLLNTIDACTIAIYSDVARHFRFIYCIERLALQNKVDQWVNCLGLTGLSRLPMDCYKSGYGKVLEQKYASETSQLNPPHRFVPWVVVNNQPLQEGYQNFMSYVCKAYKGPRLPDACRSILLANNSLKKANTRDAVCYAS